MQKLIESDFESKMSDPDNDDFDVEFENVDQLKNEKKYNADQLKNQKKKISSKIEQLKEELTEQGIILDKLKEVETQIIEFGKNNPSLFTGLFKEKLKGKYVIFDQDGDLSDISDSPQDPENGYCFRVTDLPKGSMTCENVGCYEPKAKVSYVYCLYCSSCRSKYCAKCGTFTYKYTGTSGRCEYKGGLCGSNYVKCSSCGEVRSVEY